MKLIRNLILLWNIHGYFQEGQYFVTDTSHSFSDVPCMLAQPPLKQESDRITVELPGISIGESIWVGYGQSYGAFNYIGCVAAKNFAMSTYLSKSFPGYCYSVCNSKFGMAGNECYCLPDNLNGKNITEKYCTDVCTTGDPILCGRKRSDGGEKYLSIYSFVEDDQPASTPSQNCLYLSRIGEKIIWNWTSCSTTLKVMCFNGTTVNILTDNFKTWGDAIGECINNTQLPTTTNTFRLAKLDQTEAQLWTGVMGSWIIRQTNGKEQVPNLQPGVLHKGHGNFVLSFANDGLLRRAVCVGNAIAGSNVGVPIGVSVAVAIIVGIVIAVIIYLKRRNNPFGRKTKESPNQQKEEGEPASNEGLGMSNTPNSVNNYHVYQFLEKQKQFTLDEQLPSGQEHDNEYTEIKEPVCERHDCKDEIEQMGHSNYRNAAFLDSGTYNLTAKTQNLSKLTADTYSKLSCMATYDHLQQFNPDSQVRKTENTYDTTEVLMKAGQKSADESECSYTKVKRLNSK